MTNPDGDPVFTQALRSFLPECWDTGVTRGAAYGDTWALENRVNTFKEIVLRLSAPPELRAKWLRLLDAACLVDIKGSRYLGGFSRDHVVDGINYLAAFGFLMEDYGAELLALRAPDG